MRVRFWGVRGSVPWATATSIGHGCNTPCVELTDDETGDVLVLDAGSGMVGLGQGIGPHPRRVSILLTHYHWDHLQGLPFFAPFFRPGWAAGIWAPAFGRGGASIEAVFEPPYFPVPYDRLASRPVVHLVDPDRPLRIGPFHVVVQRVSHPGGAFAYRVRGASGDLVYVTDHEFGDDAIDKALASFASGASVLIGAAHFTPAELPAHKGWGHGDWTQCVRFATEVGAAHLWLFHHKPGRSDTELQAIEAEARRHFPACRAASEGDSFVV